MPEAGYQGDYLVELAAAYDGPDDVTAAGRWAAERILEHIRRTLESVGIVFDEWYSQASIEESGAVDETIALLAEKGLVFEEDGATWFRATALGDSRDRVLRKSDGDATYLAGDLAYHRDKFLVRGFDRVIDVFGADHHGQVASLVAGVEALGVDPSRLEVKLGQMVSLVDGDEEVRMSQARRHRHPLRLAGRRHRPRCHPDPEPPELARPGHHLRPGHGAIGVGRQSRLLRADGERPHRRHRPQGARAGHRARAPLDEVDLTLLTHPRELDLIRCLDELPEVVAEAAIERAPTKVTSWVRRLATCFHGFYHDCPILSDDVDPALMQARLWLVEGTRIGLVIGLGLLGVAAPESM